MISGFIAFAAIRNFQYLTDLSLDVAERFGGSWNDVYPCAYIIFDPVMNLEPHAVGFRLEPLGTYYGIPNPFDIHVTTRTGRVKLKQYGLPNPNCLISPNGISFRTGG